MATDTGRLLVVDDNEMNRDMLSRRFIRKGYQVVLAEDGYEALELVQREAFHVVLLDIMMPGISGLDVLKELRESFSLTELPVIMTTAKSDSAYVVEALKLGANDYVTKPIDFPVVLARVETQISLNQQARMRATGGFRRLDQSPRSQHEDALQYCSECQTAVRDDPPQCGECSAARPAEGWPGARNSEYTYLGRTVGKKYFMERFIGAGSNGAVYRARDNDLGRVYAAKIMDIESMGSREDEIRQRIKREVTAMVQLQNPHVVKIYEVVQVREKVFALIMDFVKGLTLGFILERLGHMKPSLGLNVIRQVAQGLYEAHQLGMIHRDVKPDNIMLEKLPAGGYFAQILDFGIVQILDDPLGSSGFCGTPLYSAPEQILEGREVDHRADIYSLGAMFYHMVAGRPPFLDSNVQRVLARHLRDPVPSLTESMGNEPWVLQLDEVIGGMMAKDPNDRYQDLFQVIQRIDEVIPMVS